jgi:hypothetical protein
MTTLNTNNILLPADFVEFMRKNYEIIDEIEKKVQQFQDDTSDFTPYRRLRQSQFKKVFESVDSCFSDADVRKIISANIKPKLSEIDAKEDRIRIGSEYLSSDFDNSDNDFSPDLEDYTYVSKKFPLVALNYDNLHKNTPEDNTVLDSESLLIVHGIPLTFCDREIRATLPNIKESKIWYDSVRNRSSNFNLSIMKSSSYPRGNDADKHSYSLRQRHSSETNILKHSRPGHRNINDRKVNECKTCGRNVGDARLGNVSFRKESGSSVHIGFRAGLRIKEHSKDLIACNDSQLTLPPLHSSVLTLLGQRSGVLKPSPRNLSQVQDPSISAGANRNKVIFKLFICRIRAVSLTQY